MLVEESRRLALLSRLSEVLGEEEARTLIECLPPVRWEQLATKDDVKASEDRIRTEMNGKFANVDAKFAQVEAGFERVWAEFATIRGESAELRGELAELRGELAKHRSEIALQMARQTRTMVVIMSGFMLTIWGTLLGVGLT